MTAAEFKSIRHALGLSASGMARALGLADGRTIRRFEAGDCNIGGAVAVSMKRFALDLARDNLDEYIVADGPDGTYLIRLHRPGFVARVMEGDGGGTVLRVLAWLDQTETNAGKLIDIIREAGDAYAELIAQEP